MGAFGDRVIVYSVDASDPQPFSSWEAGIDAGQQWREVRLNSSLIIRVPSFGPGDVATVRICRWAQR
jgi:hypothetical protein